MPRSRFHHARAPRAAGPILPVLVALLAAAPPASSQAPAATAPKPATAATKAASAAVRKALPFADRADFADAERGLLERPETLTIRDAQGRVVWDLESYKAFIRPDAPAPDSVNPSLWRNAQ